MLNIELKQLEIFREVVKCKSFSAAGRNLYLSQSTVSMNIRNLENNLGVDLFYRNGQGVSLTSAGKRFYEDVLQILLLLNHAENKASKPGAEADGDLVIQLSCTIYVQMLPKIILPFSNLYPKIRIMFKTSLTPETIESVNNCTAHVGFIRMPVPTFQDPRFDSILLYEDTSTFIVPPEHVFAQRDSVTMGEIANETMLFYANTTNYWVQLYSVFTQMGLQPNVKMNTDHLGALLEMVSLGMGVSFLPTRTVQDALKLGKVVAVPVCDCPCLNRYTLAICKPQTMKYGPLKRLIEFIRPMKIP